MDPLWLAQSKFMRQKYDECVEICTKILTEHSTDRAAWFLKCRALTELDRIDDDDVEADGIAEIIMSDDAVAKTPRPGTSLKSSQSKGSGLPGQHGSARPMSGVRPISGFARPNSGLQSGRADLKSAFKGNRPGTTRPMSVAGRFLRLGTQSMLSQGDRFINASTLNCAKFAKRPAMAKALMMYLVHCEKDHRKALELASLCTKNVMFKDWWWKYQLGMCYYSLGMYRDAERQINSALKMKKMVEIYIGLAKIYKKLDQPNTAVLIYSNGLKVFPKEVSLLLGKARIYEALNRSESLQAYCDVLKVQNSSIEAIACLGSNYFYNNQPEVALRYYRRLLQMKANGPELWMNLGLCCFYSSQYDMCIPCIERALTLADEETEPDIWYNTGHIAIGLGDLSLAKYCFKITISLNNKHAEAWNNLGALELQTGSIEEAQANFESAAKLSDYLYEACYNGAILAFKMGDCEKSYTLAKRSLDIYPDHVETKDLIKDLQKMLV